MKYKNTFIALERDLFNHLEKTVIKHNLYLSPEDDNKISMDKCVFLIDYIRYQSSCRKDKLVKGYIRLHSKILNKYLEKELKKYKVFLERYGYIKTTPYDKEKNQSIAYKFTYYTKNGYSKASFKEYDVYEFISMTYEKSLNKAIEKQAQIERRKKSADRTTKHLTKWLNRNHIQFDWKSALKWIDNNKELSNSQKEAYSYNVIRLRFHNWHYVRSSNDNRLHSNLTNLPSELRKFLCHNGQQLISLDIKSSQPFILAGVFNLLISNRDKLVELNQGLRSKLVRDKLCSVMNSISLESSTITDLKVYINWVCNSDIYNYIADNLDHDFVKTIESQTIKGQFIDKVYNHSVGYMEEKDFKTLRAYCKVLVLEYMYCSVKNNRKRIKEIVRIYPDAVNRFIYLFKYSKEIDEPTKKGKRQRELQLKAIDKSKKLFAKFLQQLEAQIVLDIITKELSVQNQEMFLATIHDSIIVPKQYAGKVKSFLNKRLFELFGIEAEVKNERWY